MTSSKPHENQGMRHFRMSSISAPTGRRPPVDIAGRPGAATSTAPRRDLDVLADYTPLACCLDRMLTNPLLFFFWISGR